MPEQQHLTGEKISIREFARRLGVRDTSVHKAIKSGKIVAGLVIEGEKKGILYETALAEWERNRDPVYADRSPGLTAKLAPGAPEVAPPPPAAPGAQAQDSADTSLAAAKRAQAVLKVQQMRLDLEKAKGNLVEKNAVYSALFEAGALVRSTVLGVPDRVIDDIMAQKTRAAAYQILYDALVEALSTVADSMKKPL